MILVWATDPHLDHVGVEAWQTWIDRIVSESPGALLITGDISEGDDVVVQLRRIAVALNFPVYFVLGNHDFYHNSIARTRRHVINACREDRRLNYLTDCGAMELADGIFLVGEDGWGDATVGDFDASPIRLNDFALIEDFSMLPKECWKDQLGNLGRESAQRLESKLNSLPDRAIEAVVLTHVPPFREACWYEGHTTDDLWAPFFVCGEVGKVLGAFCDARPNVNVSVLCGHTHHDGVVRVADNLVVHTGAATYGRPDIEAIIAIENAIIRIA